MHPRADIFRTQGEAKNRRLDPRGEVEVAHFTDLDLKLQRVVHKGMAFKSTSRASGRSVFSRVSFCTNHGASFRELKSIIVALLKAWLLHALRPLIGAGLTQSPIGYNVCRHSMNN